MPRIAALTAARVLERMILQPFGGNADARTPGQEPLTIHGDQVRHRAPKPHVAVQPEPAVHCVQHSLATRAELLPFQEQCGGIFRWWRRNARRVAPPHWQPTTPSAVAGGGGEDTKPENIAQTSGKDCGCVARADQPPLVASMIVTTTPLEVV